MDDDLKQIVIITGLVVGMSLVFITVLSIIHQMETATITSCRLKAIQTGTSVAEAILLCQK